MRKIDVFIPGTSLRRTAARVKHLMPTARIVGTALPCGGCLSGGFEWPRDGPNDDAVSAAWLHDSSKVFVVKIIRS